MACGFSNPKAPWISRIVYLVPKAVFLCVPLSLPAGLTNTLVPYFAPPWFRTVFLDNVNILPRKGQTHQYQSYYSSRECRVFPTTIIWSFKKISIYILIALIQHFSINKLRSLQLAYSNLVTRFISLFWNLQNGALLKSKFWVRFWTLSDRNPSYHEKWLRNCFRSVVPENRTLAPWSLTGFLQGDLRICMICFSKAVSMNRNT